MALEREIETYRKELPRLLAAGRPSAIQAATDFRPEVVLLDIGLPGMSGYEVARKLRQEPGGEKLILAAMTGYGQEEDRRRSKEAGFDQHFTKPVDPEQVQALLT